MKPTRTNDFAQDAHAHFAPEQLLELALEQSSGRVQTDAASALAHGRARACPQCARTLDGLLHDLEHVRAALRAVPAIDERRTATLAEATIGMTTREELALRCDRRALGRFLQRSWKSSLALRLVAAGLLLHVIAVPVALIVLAVQARKQQLAGVANVIGAAPALELASAPDAIEPSHGSVPAPDTLAFDSIVPSFETPARSQRVAQARRDLLENGAAKLSAFERQLGCSDDLTESIARTLITRSRPLGLGSMDASQRERTADLALVERAHCAERLLNDWVASGRVDRRLSAALWQVPEQSPADPMDPSPAAVLTRADGNELELAKAAGELGPRAGPDRELIKALEQAYATRLASEPGGELANWVAWGRGSER